MTKVLFRVDADSQIGLGHLQRSLALAAAFQRLDVASLFLVPANSGARERIGQSGFASYTLPKLQAWSLDDVRATKDAAISRECVAVIVDSHQVGAEYLANLRDAGVYAVVRDDLAGFPFSCQVVLNGNANAEKLRYASSSGDTVFLLGTDYMVLGQEFWDWRSRNDERPVENVLVTLGGTDEYKLMPSILGTLDNLPGGFSLTAIIGPFFEHVSEVEKTAARMTRNVSVLHSPPSLYNAIMEADLAVSAAGQTLYELAGAGCPTVAICVAQNQQGQLNALAESGFLVSAGDAQKGGVISATRQSVSYLLSHADARAAMATTGQRLVDGKGAQRVAKIVVAELTRQRDHGLVSL